MTLSTMGATIAALLVVGVAFTARDVVRARSEMSEVATTHAAMVATNVSAAVTFKDATEATSGVRRLDELESEGRVLDLDIELEV